MAALAISTVSYVLLLGASLVDNVRLFSEVQDRARRDSLTGLANYRSLVDVLQAELERCRNDEAATLSLGIAQTTAQAVELLHGGAPGIHFYTLNQSPATRVILTALKTARLA